MEDFSTWLIIEIERRGWSKSELARRAGISDSSVSMVLGGQRNPGLDFCIGVSNALGMLPERVLRRAGLLPPLPSEVEEEQEVVNLLRRLSVQLRRAVLATVQSLVVIEESPHQISSENPQGTYYPRTFAERQAYLLQQKLEGLSPEDQARVFRFMEWLCGSSERGESMEGGVVPVDSDS